MKTIIVLGTHGGGTSLVAGILQELGVNMNPNRKAKITVPAGTYYNYEDSDFVRLNTAILKHAGGEWYKLPEPRRLFTTKPFIIDIAKKLIENRNSQQLWGWKDPRSSATMYILHPLVTNPYYIYVTRSPVQAARSINSRGPSEKKIEYWTELSKDYLERASMFLSTVDSPKYTIRYEDLIDHQADKIINGLAKFVGADTRYVSKAKGMIRK